MTPQFDHHVINSFMLWADNRLLNRAKAFSNQTVKLFPMGKDKLWNEYYAYSSPFKQWVADSSVVGANIPTGIKVDGVLTPLADLDATIDFDNGRILSKTQISGELTVDCAIKDVNLYIPNENEEDVIFENRYVNNSRFKKQDAGVIPYEPAFPAIFFAIQMGDNEPFAFGGEDETTIYMKGVVMTDDLFTLEGILSAYRDSNQTAFNLIPWEESPFNELGGLKAASYNYEALNAAQDSLIFYVEKVKTAKLTEKSKSRATKDAFIGFVDFTILAHRYPRA